ncbi:MAG TPA: RecT family recombinase [Bryobacteraceae bacterium]|nr:RecT family recombinase [Bryobacteraceae bacterium]
MQAGERLKPAAPAATDSSVSVLPPAGQPVRMFSREDIELIKDTICRGASDAQLRMFLEVCRRTGLDPFLKEVWYVAEKNLIMAGRDGYLRIANQHAAFDGIETRVERDERGVPIKAVCTVWRKDRNHPTISEAYYSEYKKAASVWQQYPSAMISKVAEVLALKRSFAINGVVTEEEIGSEEPATPRAAAAPVVLAPEDSLHVLEMWRQIKGSELERPNGSIKDVCEIFAKLKARLIELEGEAGQAEYYRVLKQYGKVEHANQLRQRAAQSASLHLFHAIRQAESRIEPPPAEQEAEP